MAADYDNPEDQEELDDGADVEGDEIDAFLDEEEEGEIELPVDPEKLNELGISLSKSRSESIEAREQSGIEAIWLEDEEFYEGIDDANRSEEQAIWRQKPMGQAKTGVNKSDAAKTRSTVFPNITGPFVDSAAARVADMLLPTDDRSWGIKPTPIPDMINLSKGKVPQAIVQDVARSYPGDQQGAQQQIEALKAAAKQKMTQATEAAEAAQTRIEDWHVECQWHSQVRLVIEDAARLGTGVLKGPVPVSKKTISWNKKTGELDMAYKLIPGSKWVDPWNFYPDASCGEDIHSGGSSWERDYISKKQLRDFKEQEGYIVEQIDACLTEGVLQVTSVYNEKPQPVTDVFFKNRFEIWYFYGTAELEDLEACGCDVGEKKDPYVPVMITMINNRVVRVSVNALDTGDIPYDVMVWRRRAGHWTGIGVARQIRTPQKIVTGGTRNLMDNAGLGAGVMLVMKQGTIFPADGVLGLGPRKIFYIAKDDTSIEDATKAIGTIKVDMLVNELLTIVKFGLQLAESTTNMPMLLQGQMNEGTPDTLGGQEMAVNNASTVLRRLARLFDDRITEPQIRRYYSWVLQYGDNDAEKGDNSIDARGSSALVERELQNKELMQMGNLVLDPRFGKDPKKWMDEYLKSRRFDPVRFEYEDEEWQGIVENMQQGPQDNTMAVAQLRADTAKFVKGMDEKIKGMELQAQAADTDKSQQFELLLKEYESELISAKTAADYDKVMQTIKGKLAETTMKLNTQIQLAGEETVLQGASEPRGRAPDGEGFTK